MMNSTESILNSPKHHIPENGQFYFNGTMLGILCLMAICAIALFLYYINWAMRNARELENLGNQATIAGLSPSAATIVHLPVFAPHSHSCRAAVPVRGQVSAENLCKIQDHHLSRQNSPPPSYESIFPCEDIVRHNPL